MSSKAKRSTKSARTDDLRAHLRAHVRAHAENRPGTYRMLGPGGELLYVGKSIRVRTRLLSYFRAARGEKAAEIIAHTHRIEWDYVPSEFAALLLEFRQIKRWRPLYNVEHKRDRQYCFIKLTADAAPKLLIVANVIADGALYFGPFRGRGRVSEAIRELGDLLELRDCAARTPIHFADQPDLFDYTATPLCIRAELHRCLAPCAARCTQAQYAEQVELARRFLEGDADRPLAILHDRMQRAAERLDFEYAGALRDRGTRLEAVRNDLVALRGSVAGSNFLYPVPGHDGEDIVYLVRRGVITEEFPAPQDPAEWAALTARARELLDHSGPDSLHVRPHEAAEILLLARWFRLHPGERERALPIDRPRPRRRAPRPHLPPRSQTG
jgi:excinuclease ABC subunit C